MVHVPNNALPNSAMLLTKVLLSIVGGRIYTESFNQRVGLTKKYPLTSALTNVAEVPFLKYLQRKGLPIRELDVIKNSLFAATGFFMKIVNQYSENPKEAKKINQQIIKRLYKFDHPVAGTEFSLLFLAESGSNVGTAYLNSDYGGFIKSLLNKGDSYIANYIGEIVYYLKNTKTMGLGWSATFFAFATVLTAGFVKPYFLMYVFQNQLLKNEEPSLEKIEEDFAKIRLNNMNNEKPTPSPSPLNLLGSPQPRGGFYKFFNPESPSYIKNTRKEIENIPNLLIYLKELQAPAPKTDISQILGTYTLKEVEEMFPYNKN